MLQITSPIHGAILNRHDGTETDDGLRIHVEGICADCNGPVTIHGVEAVRTGERFHADLILTERETELVAACGPYTAAVTVLYDRRSFTRYRFSLDEDIRCFRDIAAKRYASLFDNPYLALWKRLHDTYGTKINCNVYFQCEDFDLTMMPDTYWGEWQDNADWFRLSFHALQNAPNKPYIQARNQPIAEHYDRVVEQILRFAGESVLNSFTTIHWGEATREACRAVHDRGIRGLCGYFNFDAAGQPAVSYYADREQTAYLHEHDYWLDPAENLIFIKHDLVVNSVPAARIEPDLEAVAANPQQRDVMEIMIHEQYFYPDYSAYLPDYAERCETAVRWLTEHDYKPVFWSDGFLGVPE